MYRKILIAADGSDNSLRAAKQAVNLASLTKGSEVTILYVIDHHEAQSEEIHRGTSPEVDLEDEI